MTPQQQPKECNITSCWAHKEGFCYAKCSRQSPAPLAKENLAVGMLYAYEAGEREGTRQARSSFATTLHEQLKIKHKKGIVLTYDNVCDMIRESLRQEPPAP